MRMEKSFQPERVSAWQKRWEEAGAFAPTGRGEPFVMVIPPPNVTGSLHMGHALNGTIQDLLCRFFRIRGRDVLWVPGTDHAGIATQNVVEKELRRERKTRNDLGRDAFLERVYSWKEKYGNKILEQFRALGLSLDYSRTRFTMDEDYSLAVRKTFVQLFEAGLIYRGERLINFCPRCRTALADIEVDHAEKEGKLYTIAYPLAHGKGELQIATTRPETMLGDTALCVHPDDPRYQRTIGKHALLPLLQRELPIIADSAVERDFGTGVLKVTPAHDFKDFELAKTHNLPAISVIREDGTLNEQAGPYEGLDRFLARKKILEDLQQQGLLKKIEDYPLPLSTCARCDTVIEPLISKQWFLNAPLLSQKVVEKLKAKEMTFFPSRFLELALTGLSETREWCLSRQIWWGHRIPAWFCEKGCPPTVALDPPSRCQHCEGRDLKQDDDVLDTWFSSSLWPFAVFNWPQVTPDLKRYFPTTLLSTARDILFLWVMRMAMMSLYFFDQLPFSTVIVHPTILNREGKRMSKSLGTGVDPLDLIARYGADAVRMGLMMLIQKGQDVRMAEDFLHAARLFANKLWNAVRLVQLIAPPSEAISPPETPGSPFDLWILHRLREVEEAYTQAVNEYAFSDAALTLYHFVWDEWCDWYLEIAKGRIEEGDQNCARILQFGSQRILQWLHPFMPFITEELHHALGEKDFLMRTPFQPLPHWSYPQAKREVQEVMEVVHAMRSLQAKRERKAPTFFLADKDSFSRLTPHLKTVQKLTRASLKFAAAVPLGALTERRGSLLIFCPLEKEDLTKEWEKLKREKITLQKKKENLEKKLGNSDFLNRAADRVVAKVKSEKTSVEARLHEIQARLEQLKEVIP